MNKVSQELLVRPMGIFQLLDYVGIEVFQWIIDVMNANIPGENMSAPLLQAMIDKGILGGQRPDGSQKDGFLQYIKGKPAGIYSLEKGDYISLDDEQFTGPVVEKLGAYCGHTSEVDGS